MDDLAHLVPEMAVLHWISYTADPFAKTALKPAGRFAECKDRVE